MRKEMLKVVAQEICKSSSCQGSRCCKHPANRGRVDCYVRNGGYDAAAKAAVKVLAMLWKDMADELLKDA